jgi:hypothetical protein
MNFIVLGLLMHVPDEEPVFWLLACILEDTLVGLHGNLTSVRVRARLL